MTTDRFTFDELQEAQPAQPTAWKIFFNMVSVDASATIPAAKIVGLVFANRAEPRLDGIHHMQVQLIGYLIESPSPHGYIPYLRQQLATTGKHQYVTLLPNGQAYQFLYNARLDLLEAAAKLVLSWNATPP